MKQIILLFLFLTTVSCGKQNTFQSKSPATTASNTNKTTNELNPFFIIKQFQLSEIKLCNEIVSKDSIKIIDNEKQNIFSGEIFEFDKIVEIDFHSILQLTKKEIENCQSLVLYGDFEQKNPLGIYFENNQGERLYLSKGLAEKNKIRFEINDPKQFMESLKTHGRFYVSSNTKRQLSHNQMYILSDGKVLEKNQIEIPTDSLEQYCFANDCRDLLSLQIFFEKGQSYIGDKYWVKIKNIIVGGNSEQILKLITDESTYSVENIPEMKTKFVLKQKAILNIEGEVPVIAKKDSRVSTEWNVEKCINSREDHNKYRECHTQTENGFAYFKENFVSGYMPVVLSIDLLDNNFSACQIKINTYLNIECDKSNYSNVFSSEMFKFKKSTSEIGLDQFTKIEGEGQNSFRFVYGRPVKQNILVNEKLKIFGWVKFTYLNSSINEELYRH